MTRPGQVMSGWLEKEDNASWLSGRTRKARFVLLTSNELEWHDDTDVRPAPRGRVLLTEGTSVKIRQQTSRGGGLGGEYAGRWADPPESMLVLTSGDEQHFFFGDRLEEWQAAIREQLERGDLLSALAAAEERRAVAEVRARVAKAEASDLRAALAVVEARAEAAEAQARAATAVVVPAEPPATGALDGLLRELEEASRSLHDEEYEAMRDRLLSGWAAAPSAPPVVVGKGIHVTETVVGLPLDASVGAPSDDRADLASGQLYFTDDEA